MALTQKAGTRPSAQRNIKPFQHPELVIGLVCAVGTERDNVIKIITERLQMLRYKVREIHISKEVIHRVARVNLPEGCKDEYRRINALMTAGDDARRESGDNAILAFGATARIGEHEVTPQGKICRDARERHAYIINCLKHPDEVVALRKIYPLGFYLFGLYADEARREKFLVENLQMKPKNAKRLMKRDQDENADYGQRVRDTFHMSDFFVHVDDSQDQIRNNLWRILDIMFGHPHHTPTFDEYAMFLAHAAALRSGSLSRQVGAVIAKDNEIIATGANECPKYGGGLYWPVYDRASHEIVDEANGRDHTRGEDSNHVQLEAIKADILKKANLTGEQREQLKKALDASRINDLTEFGRSVHAEMEALMQCARGRGNARGATLYTTLFSCHNCAKHMIAAGIERVVYIEPYPKSKATELHDDAISLGFYEDATEKCKMNFEPFVGIGPRRFFDLFSLWLGSGTKLNRRDAQKKPLKWKPRNGKLRLQMLPYSYLDAELRASYAFNEIAEKKQGGKK